MKHFLFLLSIFFGLTSQAFSYPQEYNFHESNITNESTTIAIPLSKNPHADTDEVEKFLFLQKTIIDAAEQPFSQFTRQEKEMLIAPFGIGVFMGIISSATSKELCGKATGNANITRVTIRTLLQIIIGAATGTALASTAYALVWTPLEQKIGTRLMSPLLKNWSSTKDKIPARFHSFFEKLLPAYKSGKLKSRKVYEYFDMILDECDQALNPQMLTITIQSS